ncbi:MAG: Rrf2 family transcriptional regulator [Spirochaetaceae bacterium]|nr:Rrf2 family transcriptional regulator [Spirochaetaceae bacterium]
MKLSRKSEYALLALIDVATFGVETPVKISDICERKTIPRKFLEQIVLILKGAGYVRTRRGSDGGIWLSKDPSDISLAEIVRLFDGALAPVESVSTYFFEHTPVEKSPALLAVFRQVRDTISGIMEDTTLADIIKREASRAAK